jgi:AraC family transcriptional regulator of arabinose operon
MERRGKSIGYSKPRRLQSCGLTGLERIGKIWNKLRMKSVNLTVTRRDAEAPFQITRLGMHETMPPLQIDRPEGTGDYLFMLFHAEARVRSREGESIWPSSSFMVWTPQDSHYYGNMLQPWDHSWFHCSGREIGSILKACRIPVGRRIAVTDPSLMEHFLLEVIAELSGWSQPDGKILRNLFENFMLALARHAFQKSERLAPASLLAVRAYVEQHFTERLRLSQLAKRAGLSEPHLCTEFRRYFGIPVIQYVLQLRMNQATYLLRDHNRRIGEIALMLGYPDLYTFSKMFKHYIGVSPKKFRELNSQSEMSAPTRAIRPARLLARAS